MICIVFGESGTGKTKHSKELASILRVKNIHDEWNGKSELKDNTLVLTNVKPPYNLGNNIEYRTYNIGQFKFLSDAKV